MAWLGRLRFVVIAAIVALCAVSIFNAFRDLSPQMLLAAFDAIPLEIVAAALVLMVINYALFCVMEWLALQDANATLSPRRVVISGCISEALSLAAGLGPVSGAGVRMGLFHRWGLKVETAVVTAISTTVIALSGGILLVGIGFALAPDIVADAYGLPKDVVRIGGLALLGVIASLVLLAGSRRRSASLKGVAFSIPGARGVLLRLAVGALDWVITAHVLFVLLVGAIAFSGPGFLSVFATAHFAGMVAGTPAGIGVFDGIMLHIGHGDLSPANVIVALVLYRVIANALPALIALGPFIVLSRVPRGTAAVTPATPTPAPPETPPPS
jgi:uncharacterized membrane protein YbhN (UPF0104 family)